MYANNPGITWEQAIDQLMEDMEEKLRAVIRRFGRRNAPQVVVCCEALFKPGSEQRSRCVAPPRPRFLFQVSIRLRFLRDFGV